MLADSSKPIELAEAGPHPWTVQKSKGGKLYIYAGDEENPISVIKTRLRLTRRELATLQLICDAVNHFREKFPHTKP